MTRWAYPHAKTGREEKCVVECLCGHKSYGTKFFNVESRDLDDAWWQYKLHVDDSHPETRGPQLDSRPLCLEEALGEIRRILDRVAA